MTIETALNSLSANLRNEARSLGQSARAHALNSAATSLGQAALVVRGATLLGARLPPISLDPADWAAAGRALADASAALPPASAMLAPVLWVEACRLVGLDGRAAPSSPGVGSTPTDGAL